MALDVVEFPEDIAWLDLSFNDITSIRNLSMSLLIDVMLLKLKSSQAISSGNSTTSRAILKAKSTVRNPLKQ